MLRIPKRNVLFLPAFNRCNFTKMRASFKAMERKIYLGAEEWRSVMYLKKGNLLVSQVEDVVGRYLGIRLYIFLWNTEFEFYYMRKTKEGKCGQFCCWWSYFGLGSKYRWYIVNGLEKGEPDRGWSAGYQLGAIQNSGAKMWDSEIRLNL